MNKTDLINEIAAKAQLNKVDAKKALDAVLESIAQALVNDDKVQLIGSVLSLWLKNLNVQASILRLRRKSLSRLVRLLSSNRPTVLANN